MTEATEPKKRRRFTIAESRARRRDAIKRPDFRTQFIQTPRKLELGGINLIWWEHRLTVQNYRCGRCEKKLRAKRRLAAASDKKLYCLDCMWFVDVQRGMALNRPRRRWQKRPVQGGSEVAAPIYRTIGTA